MVVAFYRHLVVTVGTADHVWVLSPFACRTALRRLETKDNHLQGGLVSFVPPLGDLYVPMRSHKPSGQRIKGLGTCPSYALPAESLWKIPRGPSQTVALIAVHWLVPHANKALSHVICNRKSKPSHDKQLPNVTWSSGQGQSFGARASWCCL